MENNATHFALMMDYRYYIRTREDSGVALWNDDDIPCLWQTKAAAERAVTRLQAVPGAHHGHRIIVVEV